MTDYKSKSAVSLLWGFFWRRKFRFIFLTGLSYAFQRYQLTDWFVTKRQRVYAKYCKRWVSKFNPSSITYTTAMDTVWRPTML